MPFLVKLATVLCAVVVVRCAWAVSDIAVDVAVVMAEGLLDQLAHIWQVAPGVTIMVWSAWHQERRSIQRDDEREERAAQREAERHASGQDRLVRPEDVAGLQARLDRLEQQALADRRRPWFGR